MKSTLFVLLVALIVVASRAENTTHTATDSSNVQKLAAGDTCCEGRYDSSKKYCPFQDECNSGMTCRDWTWGLEGYHTFTCGTESKGLYSMAKKRLPSIFLSVLLLALVSLMNA